MPSPTLASLKFIPININGITGENVIIAGVANTVIRVYQVILMVDTASILSFEDGAGGPDLDGQGFPLPANGSLTMLFTGEPWMATTTLGNALILDQSGVAHIGGIIYYTQY